jgi:cytochrome c553
MIARSPKTLLFSVLLGCCGYAFSGNTSTEKEVPSEEAASEEATALVGNSEAGAERYKKSCVNCHGAAGKGVASYPKISGKEISYTISMLETYRNGVKVGPNSSLMIMMAKPLTDQEIADLAVYLMDATP